MSDPIADMLTRIRNGQTAKKKSVTCASSAMKVRIADVLKREGYIEDYGIDTRHAKKPVLTITLRVYKKEGAIHEVKRCSKPGCRLYSPIKALKPLYGGLGIYILSTSKGVLSDREARQQGVGGEIICHVY